MKKTILALTAVAALTMPAIAQARDQISIVGSSTVYPFTTVVAEEFGNKTKFNTPVIESTGTGGGFKLFCAGADDKTPDFSDASRAIKDSERQLCATNGVKGITELKIGFDGIVLANSKEGPHFNLTKEQIFKALAKQVPVDGKLVDNPYTKWSEVDPALPDEKIEVYGPPTTSGTRDAFDELVMQEACKDLPAFKAAYPDEKTRDKSCQILRQDGPYIEAGENDNVIVAKLRDNKNALGIFGYSYLDQNRNTLQGSMIDGEEPTFDNISSGSYAVSRPLFVYVKDAHLNMVKGVKEFIAELTSTGALGEYGYLVDKGLIPLPKDQLAETQKRANALIGKEASQ